LAFRLAENARTEIAHDNQNAFCTDRGDCYLEVPGIAINDDFEVIDEFGTNNSRIFIMAVPYIGGYNSDYSGLDFCEAASARIVRQLFTINYQLLI
jgi:hypothetical protein